MMINKREDNCPVCGTLAKLELQQGVKNCKSCGTIYNKFGVILSSNEDDNLQMN